MSYRLSCAIELEDKVIVTGGISAMTTVSVYNDDGWVKDLAPLKSGRYGHSCGHYTSDEDLVKLKIKNVHPAVKT